jgi:chromosome segregation ATPase
VTDRALRDEIETLFAELKRERARLEVPEAAELAEAHARLTAEVERLTSRARALTEHREALHAQLSQRELETHRAQAELEETRAEIARAEPLGNPLTESRSNWEQGEAGCAIGVWVFLCVGLAAAGWWLR